MPFGSAATGALLSMRQNLISPSPWSGIKPKALPPLFFNERSSLGSMSSSTPESLSISLAARINLVCAIPWSRHVAKYCLNGACFHTEKRICDWIWFQSESNRRPLSMAELFTYRFSIFNDSMNRSPWGILFGLDEVLSTNNCLWFLLLCSQTANPHIKCRSRIQNEAILLRHIKLRAKMGKVEFNYWTLGLLRTIVITSLFSISCRIGLVEMVSTFNVPAASLTLYNVTPAASLLSNAASSSAVDWSGTLSGEPPPKRVKKSSLSSSVLYSSNTVNNFEC